MRFTTNLNLINKRQYARVIALVIMIEGAVMLPSAICAGLYGETRMMTVFAVICLALTLSGFFTRRVIKSQAAPIRSRDGFLYVITSMLLAILIGALPFLTAGEGYSIPESLFESSASWTTTGATMLSRDDMPRSLLLWASEMHFMGGFVMIFLTVSIFQKLGIGGQKSVAHDIPGANFEKLTVKMSESAAILIKLYIMLAITELLLLVIFGMDPYYAIVNSLTTMSTSGIVELDLVAEGYVMTPVLKLILIVFTLLASFNFVFYFFIYQRNMRLAFANYEIRLYLLMIGISSIAITISLLLDKRYDTFSCFYNSLIQTISYTSTSGFTLSKIGSWPAFAKAVLIILPVIGGCGFSTSSGIKVHRAAILYKIATRGVYKRIHPRSLKPVMINGKAVAPERASSITVFGLLYFAVLVLSAIVISLDDFDIETSFSAAIALLTNNGTGLGMLTEGDFSIFSEPMKLFSCFVMILGRLELFAVFVLFSRSFWDTNRVRG